MVVFEGDRYSVDAVFVLSSENWAAIISWINVDSSFLQWISFGLDIIFFFGGSWFMHCLCKTLLWNKRHDVICHVTPNAIVCFSYFWWRSKHICRCKWPRVKWESKECVLWCPGPIDPVLRHQDQYQNVCVATFYILNLWLWNLTERNLIYLVRIKLSPNVVQGIIKQARDCFIKKIAKRALWPK